MFCKNLEPRNKGPQNFVPYGKIDSFNKKISKTRSFNPIPVGLFDICKRFEREGGVSPKIRTLGKLLAYDKNILQSK